MLRWRGLVRSIVAFGLTLALSGVVVLAQDACTRTYRGDLVLEGNQRLVITEGVLCVGGEIILRDNARLEISDATLRMMGFEETLWDDQCYLRVVNEASVSLVDVTLEIPGATDGSLVLFGHDVARVHLERVHPVGATGIRMHISGRAASTVTETAVRRFHLTDSGRAELNGVRVEHDLMVGYRGSARAELVGLRRGSHETLEIMRGTEAGVRLTAQDTYIHGWVLDIGEEADISVADSALAGIHLSIGEQTELVERVRPGHHALWRLEQGSIRSTSGNLTLTNTTVEHFWVLHLLPRRSPFTLRDSSLGVLHTWRCTGRVTLERVQLSNLDVHDSQFSIVADALTMLRGLGAVDSRLSFQGSMRFQDTFSKLIWESSTVGREYEVQVRDTDGDPVRGVRIGLEDPNGRVSHRTTDQEGVVRFTIWFYNRNYDHTWHLIVPQGDTTACEPITLLTSTPVQVSSW